MDPVVSTLSSEARERLTAARTHWALPGDHPLASLHGARFGDYRTIILLGPKSSVGSQSFQLLFADASGTLSEGPLALGLHNQGPYPAFNWVELTLYDARPTLGDGQLDLNSQGLELPLFTALSGLVPDGGHLMIEYDSPSQRATAWVLTLGYPEVTSPTGFLLFQVGCRSFKNWHISEGGREGPRKLQGFKPWNEEIRLEKTENLRRTISNFLGKPPNEQHGEWGAIARTNAASVADALANEP